MLTVDQLTGQRIGYLHRSALDMPAVIVGETDNDLHFGDPQKLFTLRCNTVRQRNNNRIAFDQGQEQANGIG